MSFVEFHWSQLQGSQVPQHLWAALERKLKNAVFDSGNYFTMVQVECDQNTTYWKVIVTAEDGLKHDDENAIFLIDHAWTFNMDSVASDLRRVPGLLSRMSDLMNLDGNDKSEDELTELVLKEMWKFNQAYNVCKVRPGEPMNLEELSEYVWYIMDEFGSRIQHSDNPTFRVVPLFYGPELEAYSIMFPLVDMAEGEEATRDFAEGMSGTLRQVMLLPWRPSRFSDVDFAQKELEDNFVMEGRTSEILPLNNSCKLPDGQLLVYSEYAYVRQYLTHPRFKITTNESEADILWYMYHFKKFKKMSIEEPNKMVNQFPFEHVLTTKDLLGAVCRRKKKGTQGSSGLVSDPEWLPTTYDLVSELPQFVSYFQHREERGMDNHWICKPWNLARGLDTHLTSDLNFILRVSLTNPKVAQKYVENPVLFHRNGIRGVKFDIRYIVLLASVQPLKLHVYKRFWLRFANKEYALSDLRDYEKHFTVMNYNDAPLLQMYCHKFIEEFEAQNSGFSWAEVEKDIFQMFREVFEAAAMKKPPCGIGHSLQSRAVYGIDLMLAWKTDDEGHKCIQPQLLEVNWAPDCKRACEYYPDFYNEIFAVLFLGEEYDHVQKL